MRTSRSPRRNALRDAWRHCRHRGFPRGTLQRQQRLQMVKRVDALQHAAESMANHGRPVGLGSRRNAHAHRSSQPWPDGIKQHVKLLRRYNRLRCSSFAGEDSLFHGAGTNMRKSEQRERANGVGAGQSSTGDRGRVAASDRDGTTFRCRLERGLCASPQTLPRRSLRPAS